MTEEQNKKYEEQRKVIEAMSKEDRMKRLDELSTELFIMANSFAGNETGNIAVYLHESVNSISSAQKIFTGKKEDKIHMEFMLRSMGLGLGTSMLDLQLKDEQFADDLDDLEGLSNFEAFGDLDA